LIHKIKLIGVAVALIALVIGFADLRGCFVDQEKVAFAELVMNSVKEIPRETPGFERFLVDFPPPYGLDPAKVTHIGDNALRWDTSPAESLGVVYVVNEKRTSVVARLDQVRDWSRDNVYSWLSWIVAALGWAIYATIEMAESRAWI
jgi:hypothetical protein